MGGINSAFTLLGSFGEGDVILIEVLVLDTFILQRLIYRGTYLISMTR